MILKTQPSLVFDTTILENGIIKIPELEKMQKQNVHIVIIFNQKETSSSSNNISLSGSLKQYAKPDLIEKETDLAWSQIKDA